MLIQLRNEAGHTLERYFAHGDMEGAADYCMGHPDYGITWIPEVLEADWDEDEFFEMLESC